MVLSVKLTPFFPRPLQLASRYGDHAPITILWRSERVSCAGCTRVSAS